MGEETALLVTVLTERSYEPKTKSDKDFSWDVWYIADKISAKDSAIKELQMLVNDLNLRYYSQENQLSYQDKRFVKNS